jgi:hypothetical protein
MIRPAFSVWACWVQASPCQKLRHLLESSRRTKARPSPDLNPKGQIALCYYRAEALAGLIGVASSPRPAPARISNASSGHRDEYAAETPPSTARICPVTKLDASDARKSNGPTSSSGRPIRPIGAIFFAHSRNGGMENAPAVISLGNQPGASAFTRTPRSAQLAARFRVKLMTAALVA